MAPWSHTYLSPLSNTAPFIGLEVSAYLVLQHLLKLGIRCYLIFPGEITAKALNSVWIGNSHELPFYDKSLENTENTVQLS